MTRLTEHEFGERMRAYFTDPRHSKTSVVWVEDVDDGRVFCTRCTVCGATKR